MNRKLYLDKLKKAVDKYTYQELAGKIGVNFSTLWKVINGKSIGNILFWEKVFLYYNPRAKKTRL
jgi:transcriptional regulator with XRE-family HTH domain